MKRMFRGTQYATSVGVVIYLMFKIHGGWPYVFLMPSATFLFSAAVLMARKAELSRFVLGAATCDAYIITGAFGVWWWTHSSSVASLVFVICLAFAITYEITDLVIKHTDTRSSDQFAPLR